MPSLNSFSLPSSNTRVDELRMNFNTYVRTFEQKGLFIIPYDYNRIVSYVKMSFKVISVNNEFQSLWTNPEIGFYGYAHMRIDKRTVGSAIQLNERSQDIWIWHPSEQYQQLETIGTLVKLGQFLGSTFQYGELYFPGPSISDFSFGFQKPGRYEVTCRIGYWFDSAFDDADVPRPRQTVPIPEFVQAIDPSAEQSLGDPNTPVSPPYDPATNDYGESDPGTPEPPPDEEIPPSPFRIVWTAVYDGGPGGENLSLAYTGPQVISYNRNPIEASGGGFVITVVTAEGSDIIPLGVGPFSTQSQKEQFLATFQIIRLQPA